MDYITYTIARHRQDELREAAARRGRRTRPSARRPGRPRWIR
ncbi:hypothetical protein [Nocardioides sp. MH1]